MSHTFDESVTKTVTEGGPASESTEPQFFTLWSVFGRVPGSDAPAASAVSDFESLVARLGEKGVTVRGLYDVSGLRAGADVMVWVHGPKPEELQQAVRDIRRSELFAATEQTWNAMGVHREAEFAKSHTPAFSRGVEPSTWLTVYPFVRSYEWYILPAEERSRMLREHGMLGRDFPQVISNTVSAFALGDWEWILALEAPELTDLVDMMRHLRYTDARNHVREEVPFHTGRRISAAEVVEVLA
ncbi:hydrogen peroxide-dependent heme synthase [Sinomonas sp. ASV322]|uniref:hydrogen peroxide-dependent heme synthase n=1 Tax=Sinomonas sp. ASV322 TaxID=3041920 RepID=UPI0027DC3791|nr:hydrogen peroxide-dependent heme synthase [Sinomonas sp. ASV322]MDQ4503322.1 chlorite dismutase family protein [Sinomonas sp. ASV322]